MERGGSRTSSSGFRAPALEQQHDHERVARVASVGVNHVRFEREKTTTHNAELRPRNRAIAAKHRSGTTPEHHEAVQGRQQQQRPDSDGLVARSEPWAAAAHATLFAVWLDDSMFRQLCMVSAVAS